MSRGRKPVHVEPKDWGREVWIANDRYCGKILEIRRDKRCSLHSHKLKTETFFPAHRQTQGARQAIPSSVTMEEFVLNEGDCTDVPIGLVHQMEALEDSELFEFSSNCNDA